MRAVGAISAMLAMSAMPAMASGDVACRISDQNLTLLAGGAVGRDLVVSGVSNFQGELEVRAKDVPHALRKVKLKDEDVAHLWLSSDSINLHLKFGAELVIETRHSGGKHSGDYSGSYTLHVGGTMTVRGRATCTVS